MFGSNKKNIPSSAAIFGEEFIHTMKDDLNPSSRPKQEDHTSTASTSPFISSTTPQPSLTQQKTTAPTPFEAPHPANRESENAAAKEPFIEINTQKQENLTPSIEKKDDFASQDDKKDFAKKAGSKSGSHLAIAITITVIVMAAMIGGAYYIWNTRISKPVTTESEVLPEETVPSTNNEEPQINISPISEKYSLEKPNYLSINMEESSAEDIKKKIYETALETKELQTGKPIEFIITDSNNNPIDFSIFSIASSIKLSPELLRSLDGFFSLHIYNDNGNIRLGISIKTKNSSGILNDLKKEEKNLANSLSFLFLYDDFTPKADPYSSTVYKGVNSRYLNLNPTNTISIDYGVYNDKVVIATSKDTFRAVIDKMVSEKNADEAAIPTNK